MQRLKQELAPETAGFRTLCPMRWIVCAASLKSVSENYEVLFALWEESLESLLESDIKARVIGVQAQMRTFNFLYGVSLGARILAAAEGQQIAKLTLDVLKRMCQPEQFHLFYKRVLLDQECFGIPAPSLHRKRTAPCYFQIGSSVGDFHSSAEDYYRMLYYEALDLVIEAITKRFDQPVYKVYRNPEDLILKACRGQEYTEKLDFVCSFYKSDLDRQQLQAQLPLLLSDPRGAEI